MDSVQSQSGCRSIARKRRIRKDGWTWSTPKWLPLDHAKAAGPGVCPVERIMFRQIPLTLYIPCCSCPAPLRSILMYCRRWGYSGARFLFRWRDSETSFLLHRPKVFGDEPVNLMFMPYLCRLSSRYAGTFFLRSWRHSRTSFFFGRMCSETSLYNLDSYLIYTVSAEGMPGRPSTSAGRIWRCPSFSARDSPLTRRGRMRWQKRLVAASGPRPLTVPVFYWM